MGTGNRSKKINGKDKFFLYFANSGGGIGVLTADSPIGPWTDPIGKPLVTPSTPGMSGVVWLFDPAVFVDDDGTGYMYAGEAFLAVQIQRRDNGPILKRQES